MNKKIFLLFLVMGYASANAQFRDDFTDGNFTSDPEWSGDTAQFSISSSFQLRLETSGADTAWLVTQNQSVCGTQWDFWVKMSFNTSANNYCRFYLASDQPSFSGPLAGYFLQAGGSNDSVTFCRQNGTNVTELLKCLSLFTGNSTNIFRFRIIHEDNGIWRILADPSGSGNFREEGTCSDTSITSSSWFGIFCRFTSSNATKFYFDDLSCSTIVEDTISPVAEKIIIKDDLSLEITFSEPVDSTDASDILNFISKKYGNPSSASRGQENQAKVCLVFPFSFEDEFLDTLIIRNIRDKGGNMMDPAEMSFFRSNPDSYDILITEIMADPDPSFGLPLCEYVELYNNGQLPADLSGWKLEFGSSSKFFPEAIINPGKHLILTKGSYMGTYGPCIDLFTSASSLSNEGTTITLKDLSGHVIHSVSYEKDWHDNNIKEEGGWALEMVDPMNPCGCKENWRSSSDLSGGTPGRINSVASLNPDTIPPYIKGIRMISDSVIALVFPESMDTTPLTSWYLDDEIVNSHYSGPSFREVYLIPAFPLARGIGYGLTWNGDPADCAGNLLIIKEDIVVAFPDTAAENDVVINEVLPDPVTEGARFIEIYNTSDKIVDLFDLVLCAWDSVSGSYKDVKNISGESFLFFPGRYLVLTNDPDDIFSRYYCPEKDVILPLSSLPSMTNDFGDIILARKHDGAVIDRMQYFSEMHFPLLNEAAGVSLEKIDPRAPSLDPCSWHSASSSCGYATPGYRNSQFSDKSIVSTMLEAEPDVFSPDNDGYQDILRINIAPGYSQCSLNIFDPSGRHVRRLSNNKLEGDREDYFWDGLTDERKKAPPGIFIIYLEALDASGKIFRAKKAIGLAP